MRKLFFGILILAIFVIAVLNVSAGIEPGTGWEDKCSGDIILSKSIYWGEVWAKCDMPEVGRIFGRSRDWERGCYGNIVVYALPGVRNIHCIEWGIP